MRRSLWIRGALAAVVLGAALPPRAAAQVISAQTTGQTVNTAAALPTPKATDVIVGQLVDSACNMAMVKMDLVLAPAHLKCAITCAQKGGRLAVITDKGLVYVLTGALTQDNNAKLVQFVNQKVTLTGTLGAIQPLAAAVPAPSTSKVAPRRPSGTEDGVVSKTVKTGDFRSGDVASGSEPSIEVVSIDLVPAIKPIVP